MVLGLWVSLLAAGCEGNLFRAWDVPRTEDQWLERARQCFDRGDYSCAREAYGKLSSSDKQDLQQYELALLELEQEGFGVSHLLSLLQGADFSQGGSVITRLAGNLSWRAGEATRLNFFRIYRRHFSIQSPSLRLFLQFVTTFVITSELLAESAQVKGQLRKADLVQNPTACLQASLFNPGSYSPACDPPVSSPLQRGSAVLSLTELTSEAALSGAPTLAMLQAFLLTCNNALQNLPLFSGGLATATLSFTNRFLSVAHPSNGGFEEEFFRQTLIAPDLGGLGE